MVTRRNDDALAELAHPAGLAHALARAFDGVDRRHASVGLQCEGESAIAVVCDRVGGEGGDVCERAPVGCLAKLLTATLALRTFATAAIGLDTGVCDLLGVAGSRARLERVTLQHLLEHTHGLDDSLLDSPRLCNGFIDSADLVRRATAERPLAPPGSVYSYGSVGLWLIAAAIERVAARPYAQLLRDGLLAPLGIDADLPSRYSERPLPCPASGLGLSLTVGDWLRFLTYAAGELTWPSLAANDAAPAVTPLPGWNPLERGVYRAWKYHGGGWFGHQSVWPRSSALVRVNPRRRIALAVQSHDHAAAVVACRIFAAALPELFDLRAPRLLARGATVDARRYAGCYVSAALRAQIVASSEGLELHVRDRARALRERVELVPASADTLFARAPAIDSFPFVQVVAGRGDDRAYLWNGRFVLPRR